MYTVPMQLRICAAPQQDGGVQTDSASIIHTYHTLVLNTVPPDSCRTCMRMTYTTIDTLSSISPQIRPYFPPAI